MKELNYETTEKVFMTLEATASPFADTTARQTSNIAVIVHVEDTNDHAPEFISTNIKEIQQGMDVGVPFHRLLAVDRDSGEAGTVRYMIDGGNADDVFQLDGSTGLVSLKERPRRSSYRLSVRAEDGGKAEERNSANQILEISVVQQMSGPPVFQKSIYTADVMEHSPKGTPVTTLQVLVFISFSFCEFFMSMCL